MTSWGFKGISPFSILRKFPRVVTLALRCNRYEAVGMTELELEVATLKDLALHSTNVWTEEELRAVFTFFPNLEVLDLAVQGLANVFDEQVA